jgi:hypothetical protein
MCLKLAGGHRKVYGHISRVEKTAELK